MGTSVSFGGNSERLGGEGGEGNSERLRVEALGIELFATLLKSVRLSADSDFGNSEGLNAA